ncbi:hypothetical protein A2U01_0043813, partial [Trifolium medium]|nr:hypothetical protein [Trifolium medium]
MLPHVLFGTPDEFTWNIKSL